ncbi:MAG: hypothetical protein R8P61_10365 [Bacteroidia bacterium]|nr:hypothetical protein [Bacteroidia bacterium]
MKKDFLIKIVLGFSLLWALSSCFQVRNVEPPGIVSSDWISPTDYEILLQNLQRSVGNTNVQNYLRCFNNDSLRFTPAASLFNDNEPIWLAWSIQDEQAYFDNMIQNLTVSTGNSLVLRETELQNVDADSLTYVGEYTLRINHRDTTLTTLFKGQIQLLIKLNEFNEWEISRWQDIELIQDSSWSQLKLSFVQ